MHAILHPLLALLACATRQELARQVAYLKEENRILRSKLPKTVKTTPHEKRRLVRAGRRLGLQLKSIMSIVSYQTFRRWVKEVEQRHVAKSAKSRPPGRPRTPESIRDLILQMRQEAGWGYTRILGELKKLGIKISRQTVKTIIKEAGLTPDPVDRTSPDSWDNFLQRHADVLWQTDFLSKPMWTTNGIVSLYMLVFIHMGTRRCWISPCTVAPDANWTAQQARNFLMDAEDLNLKPQIVMRDNDTKFTSQFDNVFKQANSDIKRNTIRSPNLRAHVERFIQTFQNECLHKFVIIGHRQLNHISREFMLHYNRERPHSARDSLPPDCQKEPEQCATISMGEVTCKTRLGGTLLSYERWAA